MKHLRKLIAFVLILVFSLTPVQAFAMGSGEVPEAEVLHLESGRAAVMPRWSYTAQVILNLSFSGSTAVCELGVTGSTTSSGIKANLWLYQKNDNGSWTVLNSWKNITTTNPYLDIVRYYNPVYYGETYKLYFTGKCYGPNGVYYDALAADSIVTR
ncbi:MAG: hypothetical protein IKU83_06385 [Lachnospiraceae bacterium]|nr:hypothetical protein [Lachnospiraceae bacterium]